ncbi:hypothetical protein HPO96_04875 [Kribbella sandramycini]|uniref:Uncharacterized protein n=1 Tax=Kribbella sandramycini TaxID=60450 RepID=A0A7Y4NZ34_9ACTN|nr:hypothetical protein [Kribbella sandramycini]MBB6567831.1 hypothetical protein [Kribbella sandramycini]NOL39574.1 hypothetical protein [Kribbella sandramycini]
MTIHEELQRTRTALIALEKSLVSLRNHLGPHLDVLRLLDDHERCTADLRRLEEQIRIPQRAELMVIPDDDRDHGLWGAGDVDHEGVGAPGRRAP